MCVYVCMYVCKSLPGSLIIRETMSANPNLSRLLTMVGHTARPVSKAWRIILDRTGHKRNVCLISPEDGFDNQYVRAQLTSTSQGSESSGGRVRGSRAALIIYKPIPANCER